ncbi:MAG: peptidase, partial [Euryarchaeota archaeon]|nr:peptidase [Euryarchaeota archaeon]
MDNAIARTPSADSSVNEAQIRELQDSIDALKTQMKEMHSKLLEAAILNNKYVQTITDYQKQIEQLKKPPLFICSVVELFDGMALLRQHGSNQEIVTTIPDEMKQKTEAGSRVAVTGNLSIVRVLSKSADVRARVMELTEAPDVDYNMIGGLGKQIDEVVETLELPLT